MQNVSIAIIDGGGANIASLQFALARLGIQGELTLDANVIRNASHVILPGVGAAADSMARLEAAGLVDVIPTLEQPFLGICLGLQLLFSASEEDQATCLNVFPGQVRLLESAPDRPVPHMGWNQIRQTRASDLLDGIPDGTYFYFVHSYAAELTSATLAQTEYGIEFTAIAERDNFAATQFHPERSGQFGSRLLENFLSRTASP